MTAKGKKKSSGCLGLLVFGTILFFVVVYIGVRFYDNDEKPYIPPIHIKINKDGRDQVAAELLKKFEQKDSTGLDVFLGFYEERPANYKMTPEVRFWKELIRRQTDYYYMPELAELGFAALLEKEKEINRALEVCENTIDPSMDVMREAFKNVVVLNEILIAMKASPYWITYKENREAEQREQMRKAIEEDNKVARKNNISTQFSSWDGSHTKLTQYIKTNMNDPKSYKHVETRYSDMKTHLIVVTKFRGKNAFGALVLNQISAKVDLNGNVIEIIDQQP